MVVQRPYNWMILHLLLWRLLREDLRRRRALCQHPLYIQDLQEDHNEKAKKRWRK